MRRAGADPAGAGAIWRPGLELAEEGEPNFKEEEDANQRITSSSSIRSSEDHITQMMTDQSISLRSGQQWPTATATSP